MQTSVCFFIAERKPLGSGAKTIRFYKVPKLAMLGGYFIDTWVSFYFPFYFFMFYFFKDLFIFYDSSFDFTKIK